MTRRFFQLALAFGLLATIATAQFAQAQTIFVGPGGVQYRGYGRGYYGGYGQGYQSYGPRVGSYTMYGAGPYGYGSGSQYQFRSNGYYGNGILRNYNGYGNSGYYPQPYVPVYNPYGFSYSNGY
jgi:hypothetical protein